jgi:MFS family permease
MTDLTRKNLQHDAKSHFEKPELRPNASSTSLDRAAVYLYNHAQSSSDGSVNAKELLWKIDRRIIPIAGACYTMQFIDKANLNYAAVMGLPKDLELVGDNFTNAATALYIAYLIAEVPTGYILQMIPPGKWLGINVILWGIVTASIASISSYRGLLVTRILLGIFEAALSPCLMFIIGMWYTQQEAVHRFGAWFCGLGVAQIFGGLVSFGFQQVTGDSLAGWRIMFIVLGTLTVFMGILTVIFMPDNPMSVGWLTEAEKKFAIQRVAINQTGIQNRHFKLSHLKELVLDLQIWLLVLLTILISISAGIISTYSTTVIRNFGYSSPQAALLNMPGGIVTIIATVIAGYFAGIQSKRCLWISILALHAVLGSALMCFLPMKMKVGHLIGIYFVNAITPVLNLIYSLVVANVAGQTKRAFAAALVSGSFAIGSIIGPQTFRAKDAPQYMPAKIIALATQAGAVLVAVVARLYYGYQNSRKDKAASSMDKVGNIEWMNLTDKENKTFRYHY